MVRQAGVLNWTAVGPGSNLDGGAGFFFIHYCFAMVWMVFMT